MILLSYGRWLSILLIWVLVITSVAWALPDGKLNLPVVGRDPVLED